MLETAAMPVLDNCALYAEWVKHAEAKASVLGQVVSKPQGGRPKGGIARAAEELPMPAENEKAREKFIRPDWLVAQAGDYAAFNFQPVPPRHPGRKAGVFCRL